MGVAEVEAAGAGEGPSVTGGTAMAEEADPLVPLSPFLIGIWRNGSVSMPLEERTVKAK